MIDMRDGLHLLLIILICLGKMLQLVGTILFLLILLIKHN